MSSSVNFQVGGVYGQTFTRNHNRKAGNRRRAGRVQRRADDQNMSTRVVGESRRSTRVPLQILITLLSLDEPLTGEGETITVNRHGALISSSVPLRIETKIAIHVLRR